MRQHFAIIAGLFLLSAVPFAQDWKSVHKSDEVKWAKETKLEQQTIHKMWRQASHADNEKDDESRIADIDLQGLADHRHVLFVTYAGEKNCLTLTIFRQLTETSFSKFMAIEQDPDGKGFCDTPFGSPRAAVVNGVIEIGVPHAASADSPGNVDYTVYSYEWNGLTYRMAGKREKQGKP
jgi:hypothetical protein